MPGPFASPAVEDEAPGIRISTQVESQTLESNQVTFYIPSVSKISIVCLGKLDWQDVLMKLSWSLQVIAGL